MAALKSVLFMALFCCAQVFGYSGVFNPAPPVKYLRFVIPYAAPVNGVEFSDFEIVCIDQSGKYGHFNDLSYYEGEPPEYFEVFQYDPVIYQYKTYEMPSGDVFDTNALVYIQRTGEAFPTNLMRHRVKYYEPTNSYYVAVTSTVPGYTDWNVKVSASNYPAYVDYSIYLDDFQTLIDGRLYYTGQTNNFPVYQSGSISYRFGPCPQLPGIEHTGLYWGFDSSDPNISVSGYLQYLSFPAVTPSPAASMLFTNRYGVDGSIGGTVTAPETSNSWVIVTNQVLTTSGILSGSINTVTTNKACGVEFYPSIPVAAYEWMKPGNVDVKWMVRLFAGETALMNSAGEIIWFNLMPDGVDKLPTAGVIQ